MSCFTGALVFISFLPCIFVEYDTPYTKVGEKIDKDSVSGAAKTTATAANAGFDSSGGEDTVDQNGFKPTGEDGGALEAAKTAVDGDEVGAGAKQVPTTYVNKNTGNDMYFLFDLCIFPGPIQRSPERSRDGPSQQEARADQAVLKGLALLRGDAGDRGAEGGGRGGKGKECDNAMVFGP